MSCKMRHQIDSYLFCRSQELAALWDSKKISLCPSSQPLRLLATHALPKSHHALFNFENILRRLNSEKDFKCLAACWEIAYENEEGQTSLKQYAE